MALPILNVVVLIARPLCLVGHCNECGCPILSSSDHQIILKGKEVVELYCFRHAQVIEDDEDPFANE